jgi:hypothetical protein
MPRAKKAAANGAASGEMKKADMIREVAQTMKRPIRPRDVIAAVREKHGAKVTSPQVSKILKNMGLKRKSRRRGRAAANGSGGVSKAERIRQIAHEIGRSVRPRDIVARMAAEGTPVAAAQVSTVLAAAKLRGRRRRGRRGRRMAGAVAANASTMSFGQGLDVQALVAAKLLVEKVGGLERAEAAISVLKKLQ